jgi:hypothetical protein
MASNQPAPKPATPQDKFTDVMGATPVTVKPKPGAPKKGAHSR